MHILCVGLNHDTAAVDIRERFSFTETIRSTLYEGKSRGLTGLVILSTCNRVEVYATSLVEDDSPLVELLLQNSDTDSTNISKYLYHYADQTALQHLMQVAAGLDSIVLGEPQILGQIIKALQMAHEEGSTNPILTKVFQKAIHAGKRVRNETAISRNPTSIAGMAVRLAAENLPSLSSMQVTVLGAGETASLVVGALRQRGVENLQVLNRTVRRAQELAEFWGGSAHSLRELPAALKTSDLVISSMDSRQPIVQSAIVAEAMQFRPRRRLTLIDVAVPRNVASETAKIPNVFLHDMDTLQNHLARSVGLRAQERSHAERILSEELDTLNKYFREYEVLPLISAMYQRAEAIRKTEFDKTIGKIEGLTSAEQNRIDAMTRAMVKKLLHVQAKNLRAASHIPENDQYVDIARHLLDLNEANK